MICNICGKNVSGEVLLVGDCHYVTCDGCHTICMDPRPDDEELARFYGDYRKVKEQEGCGYLTPTVLEDYLREKEMTFSDLGVDTSMLKGVRANGPFMHLARLLGADAVGIDLSEDLILDAREQGFECRVAHIGEVCGTFDVICLWDVIEHIPDPRAFLFEVCRLSRPGTQLFIQTPRYGRIAELLGSDWRYLLPMEHVVIYSLESLSSLLKQFSFGVRSWVSFGSGNTTGTIPPLVKRAFDKLAKETGHGDTMAIWAVRET